MTSTFAATEEPLLAAGDAASLLRTLDIFTADRYALVGWLNTFDHPTRAETVAERSYWHPNGFAKLVLQAGTEHKIRLHVWPAGENRAGESNPHGHRWNFASTVLRGDGLEEVHYRESDAGEHYGLYRYVSTAAGGVLKHMADVKLAPCYDHVVANSDRYMVDTRIVHTVRPLGTALVATLVVQGPARVEFAPVYCAPGVIVDEPVKPITAVEVRELIGSVLTGLG